MCVLVPVGLFVGITKYGRDGHGIYLASLDVWGL